MLITRENIDSKIIVHVDGRIDTRTAPNFEKYIFKSIDENQEDTVIDFKNVEYISSAGLRSLLLIAKQANASKRNIAICSMNENVIDVIRITGFLTLFRIFPDIKSAISNDGSHKID